MSDKDRLEQLRELMENPALTPQCYLSKDQRIRIRKLIALSHAYFLRADRKSEASFADSGKITL